MCCCVMAARKAGQAHSDASLEKSHNFVWHQVLSASVTLALTSAHCKRAGPRLLALLRHGCRQLSLCSFESCHGADTGGVCDVAA